MLFPLLTDLWQYVVVPSKRLRALLVLIFAISAVSIYFRLFSPELEIPNAFESTISAVTHSTASSLTSIQQRSCFIFIVGKLSNPSTGRSFPHPNIPQHCVQRMHLALASSIMSVSSSHPLCLSIMRFVALLPNSPASRKYACFVLRSIVKRITLVSQIVSANHPSGFIATDLAQSTSLRPFPTCPNSESCEHDWLFVHLPLELVDLCTSPTAGAGLPPGQHKVAVDLAAAVDALAQLRKADVNAAVWDVYQSFCLAMLLLPMDSSFLESGFDGLLSNAAAASQHPGPSGDRHVFLCQFSHCETDTRLSWRAGMPIAVNFQLSLQRQGGPDAFFVTSDDSCVEANNVNGASSNGDKKLKYLISVESSLRFFPHCKRDPNSISRVLAAYEVLKRNVTILNFDPDFFFFNPVDASNEATVAMSGYSSNRLVYCNDCEETEDMGCFGVWRWSAHHPAGPSLFQLYFFLYLTDVSGAERRDDFFCNGLPCSNICDPKSANFQSCPNGMSSYPLGPQLCDDQSNWHAFRKSIEDAKVIRSWTAGETQRVMHEDGFLDFAALSVRKYPTADTYFYGHHTNGVAGKDAARNAGVVGVHMSTFGSWKVEGMREAGLWLVPDDNDSAANNKQVIVLPSSFEQLNSHEREHQVFAAAIRIASVLNLTVVVPTFNCKWTHAYKASQVTSVPEKSFMLSVSDFFVSIAHALGISYFELSTSESPSDKASEIRNRKLHPAKNRCEAFFHYDYGSLILAGIKFKESISASDFGMGSLSNALTANINLQCESNTDVAAQSHFRKILNQQPPSDIVIGGDLACIEQLYSLLPPHSPSSECPTTVTFTFVLFPSLCKLLLRA
jgi:hypothetical protein